jgi:GT2 family glycosyltransferase
MISIIIVNYNGKEFTAQCVQSLERIRSREPFEVIIVDNASSDGSKEMLQQEFPGVKVLPQDANGGFGKANNVGARAALGEYLFFVNNDVVFQMDTMAFLKDYIDTHERVGAVAPLLLNLDGTYQHSFGRFPSLLNELRTKRDTARIKDLPSDRSPKRVDWVSFAAVMMRKHVFETIHGFDERYFMYFEDADVCCRLKKAGFDSLYCAESTLVHLGGKSWSSANTSMLKKEYRRSQLLFYSSHRAWYSLLALRIFLLVRFGLVFLFQGEETRQQARSILTMVFVPHANRS